MAALTNIETALRRQVTRDLHNAINSHNGYFAILKSLDTFYKTPGTRFQVAEGAFETHGEKVQFDMLTGIPTWSGVDATGALGGLDIAEAEAYKIESGTMYYSSYQSAEIIRVVTLNRHAKSPQSALPWIKKVSKGMIAGFYDKVETDAFPAANMIDNATTHNASKSKILATAYPLQKPAAGTNSYGEIDMNAAGYQLMRATVAGDTSGTNPFGTPTASNIRRKLLLPLRFVPGAAPDLGICDSDVYDFMLSEAEAAVRIDMASKLNFGGEMVRFNGLNWAPTARMDALAAAASQEREIYVLTTKDIHFRSNGLGEEFDLLKMPLKPGKRVLQGFVDCIHLNEFPRGCARGVDVRLS